MPQNVQGFYNPELIDALQAQLNAHRWIQQPGVVQVVPVPEPEEPDNMPTATKLLNPFRVGADPEFAALDSSGWIVSMDGLVPQHGAIGYDHGGRLAEVHPLASRSCEQLVKNISKILHGEHSKRLQPYRWRAGAVIGDQFRKECLGGHVHLDIPLVDARANLDALDCFTKQIEGVEMLPSAECAERRKLFGGQYGNMNGGDGHVRAAGRKNRLEYRAVASWLFSPRTALFCTTGYKLAAFSPSTARDFLKGEASNIKLRRFFEAFRGKDDDADRIIAGIELGGVKRFKEKHDADIKTTWEGV
jgi:hypothetical protein